MVLAIAACLWFCYVVLGVFVAAGGPNRAPAVLVRLFQPTYRPATTTVRRFGILVGSVLSLIVAVLPEAAVVRELAVGRTALQENVTILASVVACLLWVGFLGVRYASHD